MLRSLTSAKIQFRGAPRDAILAAVPELGWIDCARPEMWVVVLPREYTVEEFASEFDVLTARLHALRHPTTVLIDVTHLGRSDPRNRARAAEFFRAEADELRRRVRAWGFVSPSPVLRGAITAIGWLGAFPIPTQTFADRAHCERWLLSRHGATTSAR
jgi:hypothetical protein